MKAAVCRGFGEPLVIEDVSLADPAEGEVKVRIEACAICHSDIIYADGGWGGPLPMLLGHEAAGTVIGVGDGVDDIRSGDFVAVTLLRHCGECRYCDRGEEFVCDATFPLDEKGPITSASGEAIWQAMRTGAFAEEVVVGATQVCPVPPEIPADCASLLACGVITGFGAVTNTANVPPGANVAVIGVGGVGLNSIQGAAWSNANSVIAIDLLDEKLESAHLFGATHAINSSAEDAIAGVKALTGGKGADFVFVTVGAKAPIDLGVQLLANGGTVVVVGIPESGVMAEYDPVELSTRGQRIVGSKMGSTRIRQDIPKLAKLYGDGRLKLDDLISGRYPLAEINAAIAATKSGQSLRNVIVFNE